jgi:hypothetical protein
LVADNNLNENKFNNTDTDKIQNIQISVVIENRYTQKNPSENDR